jgi:hypothetical protein
MNPHSRLDLRTVYDILVIYSLQQVRIKITIYSPPNLPKKSHLRPYNAKNAQTKLKVPANRTKCIGCFERLFALQVQKGLKSIYHTLVYKWGMPRISPIEAHALTFFLVIS